MKNLSGKILAFVAIVALLFTSTSARAVEEYHDSYVGGTFAGQMYINQWRIDDAYKLAKKLIEKDPTDGDYRYLMCLALFYKGDYAEALKYIDEDKVSNNFYYDLLKATHEKTKDFVRVESEHFIMSYLPGKDEVMVADALEALEGAYKNLGRDFGYYPKSKILVEIHPTVESFTAVSTLTKKDIETSGTIALCKFNRLMITSPRALMRGYDWMSTLSHEYVHYLVYHLSGSKAPIWLHEGIAKHFEARFDSDVLGSMSRSSENVLARRLKGDSLITLEEMSPSMAKLDSGEDVQVAFAEVNTIVGYMIELKGTKVINDLLSYMADGMKDYEAVEAVFGVSFADFQERWKNHMLAKNLREIPGMNITGVSVKLKTSEDLSEEAIENVELGEGHSPEVRNFVTLGNLLRDRGRIVAASYEYKKAYDEDPFSVVTMTKLAYSYMMLGKIDKAIEILDETKEMYPDYPTTLYRLGFAYMEKEDYEKSIYYFKQSIRVNPFIPFVRENLTHLYDKLGKKEEAEKQREYLNMIKSEEHKG